MTAAPGYPAPLRITGIPVHPWSERQLHDWMFATMAEGRRALVANVNIHAMNLAADHPWFADILRRAPVVMCDGKGVQLGAWMLGEAIPETFGFARWVPRLAAEAAREGRTFYFLGGRPGVAARAAEVLEARVPGARVVGTHDGYFDREPGSAAQQALFAELAERDPDILLVGFGMPIQERWIQDHWDHLVARVVLPGGAIFDWLAGHHEPPPDWMVHVGLEWLWRLGLEPRRLAHRYLVGNPRFVLRVLAQRLAGGATR